MVEPRGKARLNSAEKDMIISLRTKGYSYKQIAGFVHRSMSSVKRVVNAAG